jgi:hypothetical protein
VQMGYKRYTITSVGITKMRGLQLDSGDRPVLYTDGLTEAMNSDGQEFGEQRLVGGPPKSPDIRRKAS